MLSLLSKLGGMKMFAVIALAAFSAGFYTNSQFTKAAQSKAVTEALKRQSKAVKKALDEAEEMRRIDQAVITTYQKKLRVANEKKVVITKEVVKYVKNDANCNLTVGAIGLLNSARTGDSNNQEMQQAAKLTDAKKQAVTTFTQRDEIENHADCALRYRKLAAKHDALIDWIEKQVTE